MTPLLPKHTRPGKRHLSFWKLSQIFKDYSNPEFSWTTRTDCFLQPPHPPRKLAAISDWHSTYLQVTQANPHRRSSAWSSLNTSTASHKQLQESLWKRITDGGQICSQSVASLGGSGPVGSYCHVLVATCLEGFEPLLGITWVGDRLWCGDVGVCTQTDITAGFEPLLGNMGWGWALVWRQRKTDIIAGFKTLLGIRWVGDQLWCGDMWVCIQTDINTIASPIFFSLLFLNIHVTVLRLFIIFQVLCIHFIDLVEHSVFTFVSDILCYRNDCYYCYYY